MAQLRSARGDRLDVARFVEDHRGWLRDVCTRLDLEPSSRCDAYLDDLLDGRPVEVAGWQLAGHLARVNHEATYLVHPDGRVEPAGPTDPRQHLEAIT